ncbi:MAG: crossover junction endodeoxyribonuclease RuvC [Anaerolineales bacterium]|nr:crossover junction endodeoxyribonuclease RuvC [Anaerolineales bacterium]
MLVLGVDPGVAITGYGLVCEENGILKSVAYGVITTEAGQPLGNRLKTIYFELHELAKRYKPTQAAVEKLFFSKNVRTAMSVGQARGVSLLALVNAGLTPGDYTPLEIKQSVTGYGRAEKIQVQQMVTALLNLPEIPQPDDAADALAVAICHLNNMRIKSLVDAR